MNMDRASAAVTGQTLYYPIPTGDALNIQLAKRPASLKGLKIGFLGNLKPNCDVLLHTTEAEVDYAIDTIVKHVKKLREMSPLWEMVQEGIDLKSIQWSDH